jgi:PAS domain S-box-containing protein
VKLTPVKDAKLDDDLNPSMADILARLQEAEETLHAIRNGDVDAVVVTGPAGQQVYTLENADRPYRVLIEQMQDGAVTLSVTGIILYANQRFATMVRERREALIGSQVNRLFQRSDGETFRQLLAERQESRNVELTLCAADGLAVPVNVSLVNLTDEPGASPVVCCVVTDLTQIRRRNQDLAASNARLAAEIEERRLAEDGLQLALDAAGMGNWHLDLVTGIALRSPRHDQIFGYPGGAENWTLSKALDHFIPDDRFNVTEAFALAETSGALNFKARIERANDKALRWLHVEGRTYHVDGIAVRIAGVVTDITDRRELEEQLRQSQKMEAVGQLTGGLAHDFNNLLTGITGSLELLQARIAQGRIRDVDRYVNAAQGAAKRAAALTHRLLAFSRRQTLDPKPTDINQLVAGMKELIDRTVGPAIAVETVGLGGLWATLVDPGQLENALLNLCINARDAMPDGGQLTIETGNRWLDERTARERDLPLGQYVSLCVSDTGAGMTPDVAARAFDPFFTTKPIGQGTGLGLSMIYGFCRQSSGQVRIYSEIGHGTMVCLYLPRYRGKVSDVDPPTELSASPRAQQGETVLVVDDEPTVRMLVTEVLEELGYKPIEAAEGAGALTILRSHVRIDLLVTDVGLPGGMNGRQVADAARALRPELKVLFITGYAENAVLSHGHLDHGMHVLTKPFGIDALARRIKDLIDK